MRELAPTQMVIPAVLLVLPKVVEYAKEYVIVERIDGRVLHRVSWKLRRWRQWRYVLGRGWINGYGSEWVHIPDCL
jgi:hypothetical protein